MCQGVGEKKQGCGRPSSAAATRAGQNSSASEGRRPEPRSPTQAAPETPRARRKRLSLKAAAAAATPAHKGRPPRARPGSPRPRAPELTAPLRRAALTRPHARRGRGAAGDPGRSLPPPLPLPCSHGLPPAPWPAPAAALPAPRCRRLTPAFIWLTAPFSFAPPESQNNWSRAGAGRKRKAGRAEAARVDANVCVWASRAVAGQPGRVRGAGSPGHPAGAQEWPGEGSSEGCLAALGILCCCSYPSLRCLPEIQILGGRWAVCRMGSFLSLDFQSTFSLLRPGKCWHHRGNPQFRSKWVQRTVSTSDASSQFLLQCSGLSPRPKFQSKALEQQVLVVCACFVTCHGLLAKQNKKKVQNCLLPNFQC